VDAGQAHRPADSPPRVLIVDDQALFRQGLRTLLDLEESIEVVGTAVDGSDAIQKVEELAPDVVLMDLRMPVMDGIAATRAIKRRHPGVYVLVLTTFDDDESIVGALQAGASGYVLKNTPSEELARDIRVTRAGGSVLSPSVAGRVIAEMVSAHERQSGRGADSAELIDEEGRERLSDRELEVLALAAAGLTNREIGYRLSITEGTVKNHVSAVLSKLRLRDRTQAVLFARERGWV
jgi:DNA-binding NarL/FixJ family response regulator